MSRISALKIRSSIGPPGAVRSTHDSLGSTGRLAQLGVIERVDRGPVRHACQPTVVPVDPVEHVEGVLNADMDLSPKAAP